MKVSFNSKLEDTSKEYNKICDFFSCCGFACCDTWAHFIPLGMSKAFHSDQNRLFIPAVMKWIDFNLLE